MALNGARLGLAIYTAIQAIKPDPADEPMSVDDEKAIWLAAATEIVNEITTNAVVTTAVNTTVTTPDTINGTGAGAGTGTVA